MEDLHETPDQHGKKRKRDSRKGLPARHECPHCDKSYTRAEHLQRHSLNHVSQKIYSCPVIDCPRTFVRPDLYERHARRHSQSQPSLQSPLIAAHTREEQMTTSGVSQTIFQSQQQSLPVGSLPSLSSVAESDLPHQTTMSVPDWDFLGQQFDTAKLGSASGEDGFAA